MFVVEFLHFPLATSSLTAVETVACVVSNSDLIDFFEKELELVDKNMVTEVEDILEAEQWPEFTAHYRISATTGKRAKVFVDQ